jgi:hypothetical protein
MQFFPEGFSNPSDNSSLMTPELVLEFSSFVICLSRYVKADSPSLRIVFSIFDCNSNGSANQTNKNIKNTILGKGA